MSSVFVVAVIPTALRQMGKFPGQQGGPEINWDGKMYARKVADHPMVQFQGDARDVK